MRRYLIPILAAVCLAPPAASQDTFDYQYALRTRPWRVANSDLGFCSAGDIYLNSGDNRFRLCSAQNTWVKVGRVTSGPDANHPTNCQVGDVYIAYDATAGSNTLACISTGTWQAQGGAGAGSVTNVATGCGLAGGPITATGTLKGTIGFNEVNTTSMDGYAVLSSDCGKLVYRDPASGAAVDSIPSGATLGTAWYTFYQCLATSCTITALTGTINGANPLVLARGASATIISDGTNLWAILSGLGIASTFNVLKGNGNGGAVAATPSTDYAPATSGSSPLKGNGSGGFSSATAADVVSLFSGCSGTQYLGADNACHSGGGGGSTAVQTTVSFSATPTFTVSASSTPQVFKLTLTGNVTSSTLTTASATAGQQIGFIIIQDATGGRTFSWPSNVLNPCPITTVASKTTVLVGVFDGTNVVGSSCVTDDAYHGIFATAVAFSNYPACSAGLEGGIGMVTDSSTAALGATVTGGGSNHIPIYCNGSNWIAFAASTAAPSGTAGGDLGGTYPNPQVIKINGTAFAGTNGDLVKFGASNVPADSGIAAATLSAMQKRSCDIVIGDTSGSALTDAQLGPQKGLCFIPAAATVVEIDVMADAGTPNIIVGVDHAGTVSNLVSAALATGSSGARACSKTSAVLCIDGATTASATLQNTSIAAGDYIKAVSGTAGGTAKLITAHVVYSIN